MSLLFLHLVEDDYPAFDREIHRDANELTACLAKVNELRDYNLFKRLENFVTQSLGQEYSIEKKILNLVSEAVATQHPHAQPGDDITVDIHNSKLHLRVMPDGSFRQSVEQMVASFDIPRARAEAHAFAQQIERVGTVDRSEYLDITENFYHPLCECTQHGEVLILNSYAIGSISIQNGYLNPNLDTALIASARNAIASFGLQLTPEIEQKLRDRHKPTIYQVCAQIVEKLTA
jgi:hypothetical protein